jgi:AmpE protein
MQLLSVLISLGFLRLWDERNPVQKDGWYFDWLNSLGQHVWLTKAPLVVALVAVGAPVIALYVALSVTAAVSQWLLLPATIVVLLYSFGRTSVSEAVVAYNSACACQDWAQGVRHAELLQADTSDILVGDWMGLHERVLSAAAYRGFERVFAVVFWFFILGPVGAFVYRLSWLYARHPAATSGAARWLWWLEWPAVRLLGLSFAVTGNFVGCIRRWRECFLCSMRSSAEVLLQAVTGALAVDETLQASPCVTQRELVAIQGLYTRTLWLWLWLAVVGLWSIIA